MHASMRGEVLLPPWALSSQLRLPEKAPNLSGTRGHGLLSSLYWGAMSPLRRDISHPLHKRVGCVGGLLSHWSFEHTLQVS
jgi:hypothetical protein